jgi:hypothetical protein
LFLCIGLACPASGEVYRWVDEHGRVHYGDRPPAENAERIRIAPAPAGDPELDRRRERGVLLRKVLEEDRALRADERRAAREAGRDRRARCDAARTRLERARRASYIYEPTDDPDNPRILVDTERAELELRLESDVRRYCGAAASAE